MGRTDRKQTENKTKPKPKKGTPEQKTRGHDTGVTENERETQNSQTKREWKEINTKCPNMRRLMQPDKGTRNGEKMRGTRKWPNMKGDQKKNKP